MESSVAIRVIDSTTGFDFTIPVSGSGNSPLSIDKSLSDLTNLTKRTGVKTINFKFVLTKDLATAYDFFSQAQHFNYKNVDADKAAVILINNGEAERGKIRITGYENKDGVETVRFLFIGNNYDWTELIKSLTMSDVTWANTTSAYTSANIKASWTNVSDNSEEHVYPLENRGGRQIWSNVHVEDMRPAFFMLDIIERTLQNVGYTLSSTFLNSSAFKKLVITHFGNRFRNTQEYIDDNKVFAGGKGTAVAPIVQCDQTFNGDGNQLFYDKPMTEGNVIQTNWDDSTSPYFDTSTNFDTTTGSTQRFNNVGTIYAGRFTAPKTGYYKVEITEKVVQVAYPDLTQSQNTRYQEFNFTTYLRKFDSSGNPLPVSMGYVKPNTLNGSITGSRTTSATQSSLDLKGDVEIYLQTNESFEVWRFFDDYNRDFGTNLKNQYGLFPTWLWKTVEFTQTVTLDKRIAINDTVTFTEVLDDKVKIIDIINDVSRIFNLFWDADTVLKQVTVEPRGDFYNSIPTAVDRTSQLTLLKSVVTKYNSSSHKKDLVFKYAIDSADVYVQKRDKKEGTKLAEYTHSLGSKFKEGTNSVSCSVLAASYWIEDKDSLYPQAGPLWPFTTRYWNEFINLMPLEMLEDHAPRLLNYEYAQQNGDGSLSGGADARRFRFFDEYTDRVLIPYVLAHQIKIGGTTFASTDLNLFFHAVTTQEGRFTAEWTKTVTEIINGTTVTCYMRFNDKQWIDFDFKDIAYISAPIELKGYWIVEKLSNYQPENTNIIKVKLLNRIEWDVQTEGTVVYEDSPVGGDDSPNLSGALSPTSGSGSTNMPMTSVVNDGDGNEITVPMTTEDSNGNEIPMTL